MTPGYRTYPIAHVVAQIRARPRRVQALYFVDDSLPADPDSTKTLFAALKRAGVPFQARIEFSQDPAGHRAAREAGCALISSGYESVNQDSLDSNAKRAVAAKYRRVISNIFEAGIIPSGNWMFGFDDDRPDIFRRTLDFLGSTDLLHASFTTEIPFPGTASWRRYRDEGRLLTTDSDEYVGKDHVVVQPRHLTPEQLRDGILWLARRYDSPERAARRTRRALANEKMHSLSPRLLRAPTLLALDAFQVFQWHDRTVPALQRAYQLLLRAYRYRYLGDLWHGTNFVRSTPPPPWEATALEGPFARSSAFKPGRVKPLAPHRGLAPAPPRP
jgi:radical SAM superfamily enzyme YgiQ (UPF0313 family)